MRVLILNAILYTSETDDIPKVNSIKDTMIYSLCMGFVQNGDVPVLVAAKDYKPVNAEEYPFEIIWMDTVVPKIFKPRCIPKLKGLGKYIKENIDKYDYIISSEVFSLLSLDAVMNARKKTIIWHELGAHNNVMHKIPSLVWYNIVAKGFMGNVKTVPRSKYAFDFISKYVNNVDHDYIDHGVDLTKFKSEKNKDDYLVVVSQLIERKHVNGIIDRFHEFRSYECYNSYKLYIIGDGTEIENLKHQVTCLDENKNIIFMGKMKHSELLPILSKAKALLVNTSKDNSMVSIVESIAVGTPVLTTSVPFNSIYINSEELGLTKDNWDERDIKTIVEENELYVKNCISYRDKLSTIWMAKQFNRVYENINSK